MAITSVRRYERLGWLRHRRRFNRPVLAGDRCGGFKCGRPLSGTTSVRPSPWSGLGYAGDQNNFVAPNYGPVDDGTFYRRHPAGPLVPLSEAKREQAVFAGLGGPETVRPANTQEALKTAAMTAAQQLEQQNAQMVAAGASVPLADTKKLNPQWVEEYVRSFESTNRSEYNRLLTGLSASDPAVINELLKKQESFFAALRAQETAKAVTFLAVLGVMYWAATRR